VAGLRKQPQGLNRWRALQVLGPDDSAGGGVVVTPCFAKEPAFVGGVLEGRAEGLALVDKRHLVIGEVRQVHGTVLRCRAYSLEPSVDSHLRCGRRRGAVAVDGSEVETADALVVVARAVLLGDFARNVFDRVFVENFSHNVKVFNPPNVADTERGGLTPRAEPRVAKG